MDSDGGQRPRLSISLPLVHAHTGKYTHTHTPANTHTGHLPRAWQCLTHTALGLFIDLAVSSSSSPLCTFIKPGNEIAWPSLYVPYRDFLSHANNIPTVAYLRIVTRIHTVDSVYNVLASGTCILVLFQEVERMNHIVSLHSIYAESTKY